MSRDDAQLRELAQTSFDDGADVDLEKQARLEQWVLSHPENARAYLEMMDQEACLRRTLASSPIAPQSSLKRTTPLAVTAMLGTVAAAILLYLRLSSWQAEPRPVTGPYVARLAQSVGCVWRNRQFADGDGLERGTMELLVGLAEIEFESEIKVLVEGPAELDILGPKLGCLRRGSVVVRVPTGATGFVLETPGNRLIDRGTEFGVSVGDADRTLVQVYDGEVRTEPKSNTSAQAQQITARQTLMLSADGARVSAPAFAEERFVRLLPKAPGRFQYLPPSNESRIEEIHIARLPTAPEIDGKLDDWQPAAFFHSDVDPPFNHNYFVDGAMAFDDEYLYVAARVGDPFPLRNQFDPDETPDVAWKGGALRVRLALDPSWSYPLPETKKMPIDQSASDRFIHLLFWYHQPTERPCLMLTYGLDLHRNSASEIGWQGAYRLSPDGRGYCLEYAVPWSLLNVKQSKELDGHTLAASWQLHWSDNEGLIWQGHLIECARPGITAHPRSNANQWGRAVYEKSPIR